MVKVADFGLAREMLEDKDYYMQHGVWRCWWVGGRLGGSVCLAVLVGGWVARWVC